MLVVQSGMNTSFASGKPQVQILSSTFMDDPGVITRRYIVKKIEDNESFTAEELDRVEEYFGIKKEMFDRDKVGFKEFKKTKKVIKSALKNSGY